MRFRFGLALLPILSALTPAAAADIFVGSRTEFANALNSAQSGDRILLAGGVSYGGGFSRTGLTGVTITSQNPANPAVLDAGGGGEVFKLSTARNVTLSNLVFQNYTQNGINIDDGGNWPTGKSDGLVLRDLVVRNTTAPTGNRDGIKLSGVDNFTIDRVQVSNWGTGGSAVDSVGTHFGLIQNSRFTHPTLSAGTVVQNKGGTANVEIRGNYINAAGGRAVGAGGSTGAEFFRFVPGDSGYEAKRVNTSGNVIVGTDSAANWINIDGGVFAHNYIRNPNTWVMRMLNENVGNPIVETQNGVFRDNTVVYTSSLSRVSNHDGPGVQEQTFTFARNRWYNSSTGGPGGSSALQLPTAEAGGVYGVNPNLDPDRAIAFDTPWGVWAVNPHLAADTLTIPNFADYKLATPGAGATFDPLAADPFGGDWTFATLTSGTLAIDPLSQRVLLFAPVPEPVGLLAAAAVAGMIGWRRSGSAGRAGGRSRRP